MNSVSNCVLEKSTTNVIGTCFNSDRHEVESGHRVEAVSNVSSVVSNSSALSVKIAAAVAPAFAALVAWGAVLAIGGFISVTNSVKNIAELSAKKVKVSFTAKVLVAEKLIRHIGTTVIGYSALFIPLYQTAAKILPIAIIIRTSMGMIRDLYGMYKIHKLKSELADAIKSDDFTVLPGLLLKIFGVPDEDVSAYIDTCNEKNANSPEVYLKDLVAKMQINPVELQEIIGSKACDFANEIKDRLTTLVNSKGSSNVEGFKATLADFSRELIKESGAEFNKNLLSFVVNSLFFVGGILLQIGSAGLDLPMHALFLIGAILAVILLTPELRTAISDKIDAVIEGISNKMNTITEKMSDFFARLLATGFGF